MNKNPIDSLFEERNNESFPDDIVNVVKEIIRRNDEFSLGSHRRVSLKRTIEFIKEQYDCNLTRIQVDKIVRQLGRRSWAHE